MVLSMRILQSGWGDRVCPEEALNSNYSRQPMSHQSCQSGVGKARKNQSDSLHFYSPFPFMKDTHKFIVI